jgi:imidazolonepropionase-like amidohydrolase
VILDAGVSTVKTKLIICSLLVLVLAWGLPAQARSSEAGTLALVGGTLVNTDGSPPLPNAVILIEKNRITRVGVTEEVKIPEDAEVIRTAGKWIIPGLIDAHIHFFQSGGLYTRPDVIDLRSVVKYEDEIAGIDRNLTDTFARYLRCGVTGVADVGGPFWNFAVRDRARATPAAPRVAVTGPLISTYQPEALTTDDPPIIKVNSPEEARALVQKQVARKPDYIKIWYIVRNGETPKDHLPVIEAVIEESHSNGLRVAVHATELETARAAVTAGADILVHSVFDRPVDDAFIRSLKERDVVYCPTLMVMGRYREVLSQQIRLHPAEHAFGNPSITATLFDLRAIPLDRVPARRRPLLENPPPLEDPEIALKNLERVHDAGVTVAMGTDAGNIGTLHGPSVFREMELMQKAGLTPLEILRAATVGGARVMGLAEELGQIKEGMLADIVVLKRHPLRDLRNLERVELVISDGRVFRSHELVPDAPVDVVQRQVNAYNARDLDAFARLYSPDVELFNLGDRRPFVSGRSDLQRQYRKLFANAPELHCRILNRIEQKSYVIDQEHVTGLEKDRVIRATAVYQVELGKIRRVWFIR